MALKPEVRVLGFDDAPFTTRDAKVSLVGIAMRGGRYVEAVLRTEAARDGDDATEALAAAIRGYRGRIGLSAVLLQNLMVGGFNVVDLDALHDAVGLPVVAVARGRPDLDAVKAALVGKGIPNGLDKWRRIDKVVPRMRAIEHGKLTLTPAGASASEAEELVRLTTVRGLMPEPLRIAHLVGAGWVLGQSKGS